MVNVTGIVCVHACVRVCNVCVRACVCVCVCVRACPHTGFWEMFVAQRNF